MIDRRIGTRSLVRLLGGWRGAGQPAWRSLADALRLLILDGRLPLDARLPGERDLAAALGVSRTTVAAAFEHLRASSYLVSRRGSGSRTAIPAGPGARPGESFFTGAGAPGLINLAAAAFPAGAAVHGAYAAALAALPAHLPGNGYEPVGLPALREAIAARYGARGIATSPDALMVTSGAQHGLALALRAFARPGDAVLIDHPTYAHAIDAIESASCRPVPVALPDRGWDVAGMVAAIRQAAPRLAYLIADFHNPTGRFMDDGAREAIFAAAACAGTVVVVDETLADLWFERPCRSEVDGPGVVRLGSMGKSFWGGLRIGWIRAEPALIARLAAVRPSLDLGTALVEQLAAATLIESGEGLDERRAQLAARCDHLLARLGERLPDWRASRPPGGLSLWVELPGPFSSALAASSEAHGVRLAAGPRFGVRGAFERFVRLPFSLPEEELGEAVERIARAASALAGGAPASVPRQSAPALV